MGGGQARILGSAVESLCSEGGVQLPPGCIRIGAQSRLAFAAYQLIWSPLLPSDQGWALIHSFIDLLVGSRIHSQLAIKVPGFLGAAFW